jgi:chromosome segregation ATPase
MKRRLTPLLLMIACSGCVSKAEHEELKAQLAACEADKKAAQDSSEGFRQRLSIDDTRWKSIETQMTAVLPQMQQDFETEREKIVALVPKEVKKEVGDRLDAHFAKLSASLVHMNDDITSLRGELQAARSEIAEVKGATENVGTKIDEDQSALRAENARLQGMLDTQRKEAATLVGQVADFDKTYLTCVDCEERLKMKEKSREALLSLHGSLVTGLSALQGGK